MRLVTPLTGRLFGLLGRMAPRNLVGALSRTAVAVASLMIAVSVTVGVSLMISSFRYTVQVWLSQTLQSDVYISVPDLNATTATAGIDPQVLQALSGLDGARRIDILRSVTVDAPGGDSVQVAATDNFDLGSERIFISQDVPDAQIWPRLQAGGVILSEPLANRLSIPAHGGSITLIADGQAHTFPVVGIHYDYASNQGTATMALDVYRRLWQDDTITAVGVRLQPGASADEVVRTLQARFAGRQQLLIRPNAALRAEVMEVFDRTFAITGALQLLATVVAFIGVLSALLLLQLEKQREVGILRAIGLTARQLWGLVMLETGLMGTVAGLLAMPTGYALALILIYVINRRSFGWTLQLAATPEPFIQALLVAVGAALLAGIYPAYRLGKMPAAEAIRYE
jgi:putative ABC transport system permease protein